MKNFKEIFKLFILNKLSEKFNKDSKFFLKPSSIEDQVLITWQKICLSLFFGFIFSVSIFFIFLEFYKIISHVKYGSLYIILFLMITGVIFLRLYKNQIRFNPPLNETSVEFTELTTGVLLKVFMKGFSEGFILSKLKKKEEMKSIISSS